MIGLFRGLGSTWAARILFFLLAIGFVYWGVATQNPFGARSTDAAVVAGEPVPLQTFQELYKRQMGALTRQRVEITPQLRDAAARQTIERVVVDAALAARIKALDLAIPDEAVSQAALAEVPDLRGKDGRLDRPNMLGWLRRNELTEARFAELLAADVSKRELLGAISAGARAPDQLARRAFTFQGERRVMDEVEVTAPAAPVEAVPTEQQLHRWYDNHPETYVSPELRRITAIVLTPETVAKDIAVSDEDLSKAWQQHRREYVTPERRTLQVVSGISDPAAAQQLGAQWITGADWPTIQARAQALGGAAVEFADTTREELPAPELAEAAFSAAEGTVAPPIHGALGTYVVRVAKVTPGTEKTLDQVRETLRLRVAIERAGDLMYDRAGRIDDLLAGGTRLDRLPGDAGVAPLTGTLDASGNTPSGEPAPIPGPPALRQQIIAAVFAAKPSDPPKLTQGPEGTAGSYAFTVDEVIPPAPRPYAQVADRVRADWVHDQLRRAEEERAARVLAAVQSGRTIAAAASAEGLSARRLAPATRDKPPEGVPPNLLPVVFSLKQGEATMMQTPTGFIVLSLAEINEPDPAGDPGQFAHLRDQLGTQLGQDLQSSFAVGVHNAARVQVKESVLADLVGAGE